MLPHVSVRSVKLPDDWDKPIPDALWPETLLSAIRHDIGALTSPRVIETLNQWREDLSSPDRATQREARRRLRAAGEAMLGTPQLPDDPVSQDNSDIFTVEAFPKPPPTRALPKQPEPRHSKSRVSFISPAFAENEPPTTHIPLPAIGVDDAPHVADSEGTVDAMPPEARAARATENDKPTTHLPWPEGEPPAVSHPAVSQKDPVARHRPVAKPATERPSVRPTSRPRPRAAMHHVRSLYSVLMPFAEELIPLAFERRSRRFWARWREVAGDHGVRRAFIESLLRTSTDAKGMVCDLIAEVHSVDRDSVAQLVDRMDGSKQPSVLPVAEAGRARNSLVGAQVKVPGLSRGER